MFRHSVSERQHIQRPVDIWLSQEGAGLTVKLLTHWLNTNKWHEWDLKRRFSYVWPKMSDDLSSDMFTEVRKTLPDWQVQEVFFILHRLCPSGVFFKCLSYFNFCFLSSFPVWFLIIFWWFLFAFLLHWHMFQFVGFVFWVFDLL